MGKDERENRIDFIELPAQGVEELQKAKAFYTGVFGWDYKDWGGDYADTRASGLGSGINADPAHRPGHPLAVVYVSDLEASRRKVLASGGAVTREIFCFPGGRRFHFTDPAGNELAVWSDR
ncbi:MAG: VOC family protein [Thermodesulfobacteriota bacterium]